jgi:hypothetical protein
MVKLSPFPVFLAAIVWAGALHAQTSVPESGVPAPVLADVFLGVRHPGQSDAATIGPIAATALRASLDGAGAYASRADGVARTAIDHRFTPDGPYGSVGFVCDNDDHPPAPHERGVVEGSQEGRLVGGTLRLPFR